MAKITTYACPNTSAPLNMSTAAINALQWREVIWDFLISSFQISENMACRKIKVGIIFNCPWLVHFQSHYDNLAFPSFHLFPVDSLSRSWLNFVKGAVELIVQSFHSHFKLDKGKNQGRASSSLPSSDARGKNHFMFMMDTLESQLRVAKFYSHTSINRLLRCSCSNSLKLPVYLQFVKPQCAGNWAWIP